MNDLQKQISSRLELEMFNEHLILMLKAGMPLPNGIKHFAKEARNPRFRGALRRMSQGLEQGESLSRSMSNEERFFPRDYVALIRVGEQGGDLLSALSLSMEHERFRNSFARRVKNACIYPLAIFLLVLANFAVTARIINPVFFNTYEASGQSLPWITSFSHEFFAHGKDFAPLIAGLLLAFIFLARTKQVKLFLHRILLATPFIKGVLARHFVTNFSQGLGILLKGKVPLPESLSLLSGITANKILSGGLLKASANVGRGETLHRTLEKMPVFPNLYLAAVASGEAGDALPDALLGLARIYRTETEYHARLFIQILDIVLILLAGAWVTALVVSIYTMYLKFFIVFDWNAAW